MRLREAASGNLQAGGEDQKRGCELPEEDGQVDWEMSEADRFRNQFVEDGGLELQAEEIGVMGEKSRVEVSLDGGEVEGIVFQTGMVALDG